MEPLTREAPVQETKKKDLICNFRAPDLAHYELWQRFKRWCQDHGLDVCRVALSQIDAFMQAVEAPSKEAKVKLTTALGQLIDIEQHNTFIYSVEKPRRVPIALDCAKPEFQRTITSRASEAYVLEKARELKRSFSYRDFLELGHVSFRKIVMRLKTRGKIVALPQRSNPRYYVLAENLQDYPQPLEGDSLVTENTTIKQMFTRGWAI